MSKPRPITDADILEAEEIQDEAYDLVQRAKRLIKRIKAGDRRENLNTIVKEPLECAAISCDYLVKALKETKP